MPKSKKKKSVPLASPLKHVDGETAMVSDFFKERCNALLPGGYDAFFPKDVPLARGITVNTLRCNPEDFLQRAPFILEPSGFSASSFRLADPTVKVGIEPYHHAGVFYGQEPSASAPAALLGVQPGDVVLDLCAAPGGKTAQLGAALQGQGLLYSNEFMPDRARILLSNVERMGLPNAVVLNSSAEQIAAALPGYFDRILVDAPCSGEGMFRKEPMALAQHSQRLVESCAALGRSLLDTIAAALRPGGTLVYSTCTFAPEEDEGAIGAFLRAHPEFSLVDTGVSFGCAGHASCCCEGPIEVEKMRRIYPVHGGEGHFMAKLVKAGEASRALPSQKAQLGTALPEEAAAFLRNSFPGMETHRAHLVQDEVWILPDVAVYLPKGIKALRAGVQAGQVVKKRFEPAHQLYMAYGAQAVNQELLTAKEARCAAFLRGEEIDALTAQDGFAAVLVDGFPLGFGKVSGGRLKNRYPKGLRNLK